MALTAINGFFILLWACVMVSCGRDQIKNPLKKALASKHVSIKTVMDSISKYEVQIKFTQIDNRGDRIIFTDYDFQVDENNYFYPASTVKFPAAVAALEKLNEIDTLTKETSFYIAGDTVKTSFRKAIQEIFTISDNAANNRLIEFLGQDDLNQRMTNKGVRPFRVSHRLSTQNADDITTKPLVIYLNDSTTSTSTPIINNEVKPLSLQGMKKGKGYYASDSLYHEPFDFSLKNYYPITAQHAMLKRIVFPETFDTSERFNLSISQRDFLLKAMHSLPKEVGYDPEAYYDSYGKFFMFGDGTEPIPDYIEIYNKVGYAYGTLTDCAYIKDTKNNIHFMLSATILVNQDGIFNDNHYEYDTIGIPFLAQLGRELYQHELTR